MGVETSAGLSDFGASVAESRIAHERILRRVDARLCETGEGLRRSEANLAYGSVFLIGWQTFMSVVVPLGTSVVLAATALSFAFVSAQDYSLVSIFLALGIALLVSYVLVFAWFIWAQGTLREHAAVRDIGALRASEYLEQTRLTARQRARARKYRDRTDPLLFPQSNDS